MTLEQQWLHRVSTSRTSAGRCLVYCLFVALSAASTLPLQAQKFQIDLQLEPADIMGLRTNWRCSH